MVLESELHKDWNYDRGKNVRTAREGRYPRNHVQVDVLSGKVIATSSYDAPCSHECIFGAGMFELFV